MKKTALLLFGIIMISSSSSVFAFSNHHGYGVHHMQPQPRHHHQTIHRNADIYNNHTVVYRQPSLANSVLSGIAAGAVGGLVFHALSY